MARKLQIVGDFPSGELSTEEVKQVVDEYLEENPPAPRITINGEEPDENGNFVINLQTSDEAKNDVVEF